MRNQRFAPRLLGLLAAFALVYGCVQTARTPSGGGTPVRTVTPELAASPTPAPVVTATAATVTPQATQPSTAGTVAPSLIPGETLQARAVVTPPPVQPTPEVFTLPASAKIGSNLRMFLFYRSRSPEFDFLPGFKEALRTMDDLGGAKVVVSFNHMLSSVEIEYLEKEYGLKFQRIDGKVPGWSRHYSVVVPGNSIIEVSELASVETVETYAWP